MVGTEKAEKLNQREDGFQELSVVLHFLGEESSWGLFSLHTPKNINLALNAYAKIKRSNKRTI